MTEAMVRNVKKKIDWGAGEFPRVTGVKCKWCDKVHPLINYFWKRDAEGKPALKISIYCPKETDLDDVFEAERALSKIGIHFDLEYSGTRDWQMDWSLWGYHYERDETTKRYYPIEIRNRDMPEIQKINQCDSDVQSLATMTKTGKK